MLSFDLRAPCSSRRKEALIALRRHAKEIEPPDVGCYENCKKSATYAGCSFGPRRGDAEPARTSLIVRKSLGKSKGFSINALTPETSDGNTGFDRAVIKIIGNCGCPAFSCSRFFHASTNGALKSSTAKSTFPDAVLRRTSRPLLAWITEYPSSVRTRNNIRRTAESSSASSILFFMY